MLETSFFFVHANFTLILKLVMVISAFLEGTLTMNVMLN